MTHPNAAPGTATPSLRRRVTLTVLGLFALLLVVMRFGFHGLVDLSQGMRASLGDAGGETGWWYDGPSSGTTRLARPSRGGRSERLGLTSRLLTRWERRR